MADDIFRALADATRRDILAVGLQEYRADPRRGAAAVPGIAVTEDAETRTMTLTARFDAPIERV